MNSMRILCFLAMVVLVASLAEAHKKYYGGGGPQPIYQESQPERCICDCARPQPVLPNKPFYGGGGYAQPRPSGGGYGNGGSYAVAGSYGSGAGQTSGGY